jgi:hypothetical protein
MMIMAQFGATRTGRTDRLMPTVTWSGDAGNANIQRMEPIAPMQEQRSNNKLLRAAGIVAAMGTVPLVITIILMQLRVVDPTLNPIGLGLLMWLSWAVALVLGGVCLLRRWLARLNDF